MTAEANDWFVYTFPTAEAASIVFNDGAGRQTGNLRRESDGWFYTNNTWYALNPERPAIPVIRATPRGAALRPAADGDAGEQQRRRRDLVHDRRQRALGPVGQRGDAAARCATRQPITVAQTTTITAVGVNSAGEVGQTRTFVYTIDPNADLQRPEVTASHRNGTYAQPIDVVFTHHRQPAGAGGRLLHHRRHASRPPLRRSTDAGQRRRRARRPAADDRAADAGAASWSSTAPATRRGAASTTTSARSSRWATSARRRSTSSSPPASTTAIRPTTSSAATASTSMPTGERRRPALARRLPRADPAPRLHPRPRLHRHLDHAAGREPLRPRLPRLPSLRLDAHRSAAGEPGRHLPGPDQRGARARHQDHPGRGDQPLLAVRHPRPGVDRSPADQVLRAAGRAAGADPQRPVHGNLGNYARPIPRRQRQSAWRPTGTASGRRPDPDGIDAARPIRAPASRCRRPATIPNRFFGIDATTLDTDLVPPGRLRHGRRLGEPAPAAERGASPATASTCSPRTRRCATTSSSRSAAISTWASTRCASTPSSTSSATTCSSTSTPGRRASRACSASARTSSAAPAGAICSATTTRPRRSGRGGTPG